MENTPRHMRLQRPAPTRRALVRAGVLALGAGLAGDRGASAPAPTPQALPPLPLPSAGQVPPAQVLPSRADIVGAFAGQIPHYWGLEPPGAVLRLPPGTPGVALTIDFCGGPGGSDVDQALLAALRERHIPATLFLNARWIEANSETARQLAADPLFELANHGTTHRPLSTNGKSAYGIAGTQSTGEVYDEVMNNFAVLTQLTGVRPRFFRPGTAFFDEIAAQIVGRLGHTPTGFSINADGGATYPAATVAREATKARPGDIIICHGNRPRGGTAQGMAQALDTILKNGIPFVHLP